MLGFSPDTKMATTFQSLNITLGPQDHKNEASTPTATRVTFENPMPRAVTPLPATTEESGPKTPTRLSFAESNGKRALPVSPTDDAFDSSIPSPPQQQPAVSQKERSASSQPSETQGAARAGTISEDVEMAGSDGEEEGVISDAESVENDENGRPSKKKKGQRFYCTDYPPCRLSFTRSEHLARHIRKHTGERPFQCHCARRFSRLDNLRQHAQTVHVNEEIPGDSLAATGTRFQRQIRTDRVRPQGARSRASTAGSTGSQGRGHSRNLSTSSIASTTSTMSTMSNFSSLSRDGSQRPRPQPLMMANHSPRTSLTIDVGKASMQGGGYVYNSQSQSGATTPTSGAFSHAPTSPYSTIASPMALDRPGPVWASDRGHARRLSVPSGTSPFQITPGSVSSGPRGHLFQFNPLNPSNASRDAGSIGGGGSGGSSSVGSSLVTSPTSSVFSRQDPHAAAEAEWRRRTWHPSTYSSHSFQRPATSGLVFHQTPDDAPRPAFASQAVSAASQQRLPGFDTFALLSERPATPMRASNRNSLNSLGQPETPSSRGGSIYPGISENRSNVPGPNDRRGHASWDMSLHQNLTKLDIASGTPPRETSSSWNRPMQAESQPSPQPQPMLSSFATQSSQPTLSSFLSQSSSSQMHPTTQPLTSTTTLQQPQQQQQQVLQPQQVQPPPSQPVAPLHASTTISPQDSQNRSLELNQQQQQQTQAQPQPQSQPQLQPASLPQRTKRAAWYNGPLTPFVSQSSRAAPAPAQRTSPEDSSSSEGVPTPSTASLDYQPSIVHANGYIEPQPAAGPSFTNFSHPTPSTSQYAPSQESHRHASFFKGSEMTGLEALVAVATSEANAREVAEGR